MRLLHIMGMANRETNENELFELMAKKLNIDKENILDYELYLYPVDKGPVSYTHLPLVRSLKQQVPASGQQLSECISIAKHFRFITFPLGFKMCIRDRF